MPANQFLDPIFHDVMDPCLSAPEFVVIFNCIKCSACHLSEHIVNLIPHVTFCEKIGYLAFLVSYFLKYEHFLKRI